MLTITHVNYIRELYFLEGKSYSEISTMTNRNYRTIKKYIEKDDFNPKHHKAKKVNNSDVLRPIIAEWLQEDKSRHRKQRHTAKRIYERLLEERPELLKVKERQVRTIVKEEREKIFCPNESYLILNHPGGEAQIDFGNLEAFENGERKKFHELILSFPKSNAGFAILTRNESREALLEGLQKIFSFIGFVPQAIWFDQMSAAALRSRDGKGRVKVSGFLLRFANHYGFKIKFCNPNSGHEKGNVENKVGTIRRNLFVPEPEITDLDSFNQQLLHKCSLRHKESHYKLKMPVEFLFEEEKRLMVPFNKQPFDSSRYESRRVNKYGLVDFNGCRYSASPQYVGQNVVLKINSDTVTILSRDLSKKISQHKRLPGKGSESINYIDFIDIIKYRPNAFKYSGIYSLLPLSWREYLASLDKDNFKEAFSVLRQILLEDDLDHADKVLKETQMHNSNSPKAVAITHKRLKENRLLYDEILPLPSPMPIYEVDTARYNSLMGGF